MSVREGLNVKLLLRVKEMILSDPKRLRMETYVAMLDGNSSRIFMDESELSCPIPECKTIACIAGWTCILGDKENLIKSFNYSNSYGGLFRYDYLVVAKRLLNINNTSLFYLGTWPTELSRAYFAAKTQKQRAKIAGKAIDDYIKGDFETI
jgi:hypothetical protein